MAVYSVVVRFNETGFLLTSVVPRMIFKFYSLFRVKSFLASCCAPCRLLSEALKIFRQNILTCLPGLNRFQVNPVLAARGKHFSVTKKPHSQLR